MAYGGQCDVVTCPCRNSMGYCRYTVCLFPEKKGSVEYATTTASPARFVPTTTTGLKYKDYNDITTAKDGVCDGIFYI